MSKVLKSRSSCHPSNGCVYKGAQVKLTRQKNRVKALGVGVAAPIVALGHYYSPTIRRFNVSAKTALVVSPLFLLFFLRSELTMNACAQRRREFAQTAAGAAAAEK